MYAAELTGRALTALASRKADWRTRISDALVSLMPHDSRPFPLGPSREILARITALVRGGESYANQIAAMDDETLQALVEDLLWLHSTVLTADANSVPR